MPGQTKRATKNPYAKAITAYYQALKEFDFQHVIHEGAVRAAFQTLLADAARSHKWTLIPELSDKQASKTIRPDGTLKDFMNLPRGHWEAKDTDDNLDDEIAKKIKKGYPLGNIIFEDTRTGVLYQNGAEVFRADLQDSEKLATLLRTFFDHIEPQIESFEKAITEFKERVPELAKALKHKVDEAHQQNKPFKEAFARFFELCQTSLNPNIAKDAVDDMLVQHLLTERLIREIFDNPEFARRNVIAAEIEKVITALTSKAFNRADFLRSLDRFYVAIENAARTITDWSDKQHFLNTIYERFFQGYSVKLADTMGIVYTPQPIVDFMCASVDEVLEKEFGRSLGDKDVNILDPCTGTGNFIVNLMKRIPKRDLPRMYRQQMFANEIMLMPYYIAAMNIEHAYYELTGEYEPFEGLCFVDTLDLAESHQTHLSFMTARNTERVERQKRSPITVIIGNPPYNAHQMNENDNNKNRVYDVIDRRIRETYTRDSNATLKSALSDAYVKFFRWAVDRLQSRDGIVCFVSNNNFVDQAAFDGMRKHLLRDFDSLFHVDLHGNVRRNPKLSGTTHNVFGIQVGVGITVAVKHKPPATKSLKYWRAHETWRKEEKYAWLSETKNVSEVRWQRLRPTTDGQWIVPENADEFSAMLALGSKQSKGGQGDASIFAVFGPGTNTGRDDFVYSFSRDNLADRMEAFADAYESERDRYIRKGSPDDVDSFCDYTVLKWSDTLKNALTRHRHFDFTPDSIRRAAYRPFTSRFLFFSSMGVDRPGIHRQVFPTEQSQNENVALCVPGIGDRKGFGAFAVKEIPSLDFAFEKLVALPFYLYDEDGSNRRENITDWALEQFRSHYKDKKISKWDIFHYVYGLLHHPGYRTKFADNLKRELPRIPFAPDFDSFRSAGESLAGLHLDYEKLKPWKLKWIETSGVPLSYRVEKMKLSKDKTTLTINESLALSDIPAEVFEYRLGNRSALEWVIDQYQISTDKRSGITSDPNREDDPEYIVRLVGQVVRVSVETVKIVKNLPEKFCV